jgi:arabinose-5-phosphate isomerase
MNYEEIAKGVFEIEANTLLNAKENLKNFNKAIEKILSIQGKVVIIGVGKSGLVGSKISATLSSTGTSSFFVHPTEAMHGDLGMIDENDLVIAISYSGESQEVVTLMPHLKRLNIFTISMAGFEQSTLARKSNIFLSIAIDKEACPLNIAPTSSTTLTMALGDAIAVALMKARDFKKNDFASFHPGGSLGKMLFVKARNLLRYNNLPIVDDCCILKDAIIVMNEGKLGNLLIVNKENKLMGLLSDGDLRRAIGSDGFSLDNKVIDYANKSPHICHNEDMLAKDALVYVEKHKIQLLAFTKENKEIIGVLHLHDLVEMGIK